MSIRVIKPKKEIKGTYVVPGDKSISHRSIILGAIADGTTVIHNFLKGDDCMATISCFRQMGVSISFSDDHLLVQGVGLHGLKKPEVVLETGNSGTTTRLMAGLLCGQSFSSILSGDTSLNKRPMNRIITPLSQMNAQIKSLKNNGCAPLKITPSNLHGMDYTSPVASAQVKSALLLAGLYAKEKTRVIEPSLSRNHTELMLQAFGADITTDTSDSNRCIASITPGNKLVPWEIDIPGDISSAAYLIAAGLLVPNSELLIKNVGVNETRGGFLHVVKSMGGNIALENKRTYGGEPVADIWVKTSSLKGITIEGSIIPTLIDEIPMLAILASRAQGTTKIKDAAELTVKETNRIETISKNLSRMGGHVTPTPDGLIIEGSDIPLHGAEIDSAYDHRIAMAFAIAALIARGDTRIEGAQAVDVSFPGFFDYFG